VREKILLWLRDSFQRLGAGGNMEAEESTLCEVLDRPSLLVGRRYTSGQPVLAVNRYHITFHTPPEAIHLTYNTYSTK